MMTSNRNHELDFVRNDSLAFSKFFSMFSQDFMASRRVASPHTALKEFPKEVVRNCFFGKGDFVRPNGDFPRPPFHTQLDCLLDDFGANLEFFFGICRTRL